MSLALLITTKQEQVMVSTAEINQELSDVKKRLIKTEIINGYMSVGYQLAEATLLFDMLDTGFFKFVRINYGDKNANK